MRNATSIFLFGASGLVFSLVGACGGSGDSGNRDGATAGTSTNTTAGMTSTAAGAGNTTAGASTTGGTAAGGAGTGGTPACSPMPGAKKGDGTNMVIDDIDDANTMFAPGGVGTGSWDLSKDMSAGTIMPANTTALAPSDGGHMGKGLHVQGTGLLGWGAALAAILNGTAAAFDASAYGGVSFWIKGTTTVQEGSNKLMVLARMPDVLPGAGSCCNDKVPGSECYSAHRAVIDVTADWTEVKIAWSDFKPPTYGLGMTLTFDPNRLRDITLSFNHDAMVMTPPGTSFDVTVDDFKFLAKGEMGNVGSGTGGTAAGGTGGTGGTGGAAAGSGGTGGVGGNH